MMTIKISHDRNACIGCGACAAVCADNWKMSDDGKSDPIKSKVNDIGCNQEAADSCPVQCIKIEKSE
ncbi:MAG: ferredoxin [Candidatus Aenigmarchaeota archaeon]|nr:ferredoxin [Candidatus Aenigmarchaeota archaeon]